MGNGEWGKGNMKEEGRREGQVEEYGGVRGREGEEKRDMWEREWGHAKPTHIQSK